MSYANSLLTIFVLTVLLTSCSGQKITENKSSPNPSAEATALIEKTVETDPLFEIDGQICQHVRRILQDSKGTLWIGTNVYGLLRYDGDSLVYFSENEGVNTGRITAILEDATGNLWIGTYFGLLKYDGTSFTNYSSKDGLADSEIWSVAIDSRGTFWIGTMNGVSTFDGNKFTDFPLPTASVSNPDPILSPNRVTSITEDSRGNMWFATDGYGVTIYNREKKGADAFTFLSQSDGLCDNNITSILEDRQGKIWFGSMFGGVSRYNPKVSLTASESSFENFTCDSLIAGIEVWSIFEDKKGNIWFPAENHGVYRYNDEGFTNFGVDDGLATNGIQCFYEDRKGRFWLGGWLGMFRYDELNTIKGGDKPFYSVTKTGPWE